MHSLKVALNFKRKSGATVMGGQSSLHQEPELPPSASVVLIEELFLSRDSGTVRDTGTDFPTRFTLVVFEKRWATVDCGHAKATTDEDIRVKGTRCWA